MTTRDFRWTRRGLLRAGMGAVSVMAGLSRGFAAPSAAPGLAGAATGKRAKSLILLWMNGGPSHLDTFDPKPGTPVAGPFKTINTPVAGIRVTEHLSRVAKHADKLAIIRSVTSAEGDHTRALTYVRTGHRPMPSTAYPGMGAVLSRERAGSGAPPLRAVSLLLPGEGAGFLGAEHAPLLAVDPENPLQGWFPEGFAPDALVRRNAALDALEQATAEGQPSGRLEAEQRKVGRLARDFLGSELVTALDIKSEPAKTRASYGETPFGRGCLLARRLVQAGVPFVEVTLDGWDTHVENFKGHQTLLATLDPAYAALLADLTATGLLDSTLVVWAGEFGRTPDINGQRGRDHHPHAFSAVLAGGPVRGGQVLGASDARGFEVADLPVNVPDLLATVYTALGISPEKSYVTAEGRPVTLLDKAVPVPGVL